MSIHLNKIENIKNTMLMSFSQDKGFDKNKVEERIQETKNQIRMEHDLREIADENFGMDRDK